MKAPLADTVRQDLLRVARQAIARAIGAEPAPLITHPQFVIPKRGVFVTLRVGGELRGCIGYPESELSLVDAIEQCAVSAAISDPRFPSVGVHELGAIDLEISVLGPIEPVADLADVVVGRHGLIVESGGRRGLLLPQVAVEWQWNAEEFASQTCVKAGLRRDAWKNGAAVFKFEAEVFGEDRAAC